MLRQSATWLYLNLQIREQTYFQNVWHLRVCWNAWHRCRVVSKKVQSFSELHFYFYAWHFWWRTTRFFHPSFPCFESRIIVKKLCTRVRSLYPSPNGMYSDDKVSLWATTLLWVAFFVFMRWNCVALLLEHLQLFQTLGKHPCWDA